MYPFASLVKECLFVTVTIWLPVTDLAASPANDVQTLQLTNRRE